MIAEARLRGLALDRGAHAMNGTTSAIRVDYATMINWVTKNQPEFVDRDRYCKGS